MEQVEYWAQTGALVRIGSWTNRLTNSSYLAGYGSFFRIVGVVCSVLGFAFLALVVTAVAQIVVRRYGSVLGTLAFLAKSGRQDRPLWENVLVAC